MRSKEYESIMSEMRTDNDLKCFFAKKGPVAKKSVRIIVIGMTGAGKSSFINFCYVWGKGIARVQDITDTLIPTKFFPGRNDSDQTERLNAKNQSKSQTLSSKIYKFDLEFGENSYELYFMDTPGLGDTRGIEQDDKNVENIL